MNAPQEPWFDLIPTRALNPLLHPLPNPPLALSLFSFRRGSVKLRRLRRMLSMRKQVGHPRPFLSLPVDLCWSGCNGPDDPIEYEGYPECARHCPWGHPFRAQLLRDGTFPGALALHFPGAAATGDPGPRQTPRARFPDCRRPRTVENLRPEAEPERYSSTMPSGRRSKTPTWSASWPG